MLLSQPIAAASLLAETDYGPLPAVLFYAFAAITLASAFTVAFSKNIVRAAVALLFTLAGVAALYLLLRAEFLAAVQLVVYVGGTLILMIFGVMLTTRSTKGTYDAKPGEILRASMLALCVAAPLIYLMLRTPWHSVGPADAGPSVESIGQSLLSSNAYLAPFELISVLLLAVMIGAAYLAKSRRPTQNEGRP